MREAFRKEGFPVFFAKLRNPLRHFLIFVKFCQEKTLPDFLPTADILPVPKTKAASKANDSHICF